MEPETQSEPPVWSASSSFTDTKSEPPGYIMAVGQEPKQRARIAPLQVPSSSIKTSSSNISAAYSTQRSAAKSSTKNSIKLYRKLSQASNIISCGSQPTKQSRRVTASFKKKELSVAGETNSRRSSRVNKSKSSSSVLPLAQVPRSIFLDPPTQDDCYGKQDSSVVCNSKSSANSSYSYSISNSEAFSGKGTQLHTIESQSEVEEENSHLSSELSQKVGQELVIREEFIPEYEEAGEAIVPSKSKYLAAAVDNYGAMVPLNSDVYEAYDHAFVSCPEHLHFRFLYTFLKKNPDRKIIIFFSTIESVVFYSKLLGRLKIPVSTMHGQQRQETFINNFLKFSDLEEGVLCTTDATGRDLDIPPSVDYILQVDAPAEPSEYIMRIARISCDSDRVGRSILLLNPGETGFLKYYDAAAIPVCEFEVPRLADIQLHVEKLVNEDAQTLQCAKNAFGSYLLAYAKHTYRDLYNVHDLDKDEVAAAFGLTSSFGDEKDYHVQSTKALARKPPKQDWMKGKKKVWPHSRMKIHPTFNKMTTHIESSASSSLR